MNPHMDHHYLRLHPCLWVCTAIFPLPSLWVSCVMLASVCVCVCVCVYAWGQASTMFNCPFSELSRVWGPCGQTAQTLWLVVRLHFRPSNNVFLCCCSQKRKKKKKDQHFKNDTNNLLFLCAIFENDTNTKGDCWHESKWCWNIIWAILRFLSQDITVILDFDISMENHIVYLPVMYKSFWIRQKFGVTGHHF